MRHVLNQAGWYLLAASYALAQQPTRVTSAVSPTTAPGKVSAAFPAGGDILGTSKAALSGADYVRREVMIPMRDGVKLYTSIIVPKGAHNVPILLTRTPYNAAKRTERTQSLHMLGTLPQGDEVFAADGYIRVFQDVRGKYRSEGEYVVTRPLRGPLNSSSVDHST